MGTGFAIGTPNATNEDDVAQQFLGFFENFQKLFGIKNYKIYVTGESYAGRYVPYISGAMVDRANKTHFDLSGALMCKWFTPPVGHPGISRARCVGLRRSGQLGWTTIDH